MSEVKESLEIKDDQDKKKETKTSSQKNRKKNSTKVSSKETSVQKEDKKNIKGIDIENDVDISPFVSNVDGNVYAISNLPEEFVATLFAWVSRSPKSFKEHLKQAVKEYNVQTPSGKGFEGLSERAKKFHEKWTVDYGHSSVAELGTAHVGIEKVSRLASAELELSSQFLSLTEYSQRYQRPKRGDWYNPFDKRTKLNKQVEEFFNRTFDVFEKLIDGVLSYLINQETDNGQKIISERRKKELEKLAFEDARYVLPLAMYTQLGMTANGRAWRDALAVLGNSDHAESVKLADDIRTELKKVLPTLLKYSTPSNYQKVSKKRLRNALPESIKRQSVPVDVQLQASSFESEIICHLVSLLYMQERQVSYQQAILYVTHSMTREQREKIIKELLHEMEQFDMAPDVFKHIHFNATLQLSEAAWHQLLRHNRKTDFSYSKPTTKIGLTIPPRIKAAGLEELVKDIAEESNKLYNKLISEGYAIEAEYIVLNCHKRQVFMTFSLWEAYHLVNLRTSEEAQWDIKNIFLDLYKQLNACYPLLMSMAKRRI